METDLLQRLTAAATDAEREAIVLEMRLSTLDPDARAAALAAAIPHWFDALFLEALLEDEDSDILYGQLLALSFVQQIPGKGYAVHERTRRQMLDNLWREAPERFRALSRRAADYCAAQAEQTDDPAWAAEAIYHRLVSDPEAGIAGLRGLATKWANYEYHTYDEIERAVRLAQEQIEAGRLTGAGADWTRLWQAKLALLYGRPDLAAAPLKQISADPAVDPALAAETAETRGDALAETDDRAGMEAAWRAAWELYRQMDGRQLDAYLVAEKMRQHSLAEPDAEPVPDTPPETRPSRDRERLIDNITAAWIDGVLKTSLNQTLELGMSRAGGQLANLVYHRPQTLDRPVTAERRLSRLFAAADHSLLILGAPGSGKTITLLQLLDDLLQQARQDASAPIPLLFNLSSFGAYAQEKGADLRGWLAEQAYDQYRLKREATRQQLAEVGRFTLLLDGLDEAPPAQREQCVAAINEFARAYPGGLVVCSRIGDYAALQNKLALRQALVLQPLANRQIESFLEVVGGGQTPALLQRLQTDWQLRETLRSPLLLNLYPQAFTALEAQFDEGGFSANDTVETRRKALFAAYVDTVFARPEKAAAGKDSAISKEKNIHWLSFLANRMQKVGSSLFFIEEMQPTWLPRSLVRRYRGLYGLFIGLSVGLIGGLIFGLVGKQVDRMIVGNIVGLIVGLCVGGTIVTGLTTGIRRPKLRAIIGGPIVWLIVGLSGGLSNGQISVQRGNLFGGLSVGLGAIIGVGVLSSWASAIQLREIVVPLWPSRHRILRIIKQSSFYGLILGLILGLIVGLIVELIDWLVAGLGSWLFGGRGFRSIDWLIELLIIGLIIVMIGGLIGGLVGVVMAFLDTPLVDKRPQAGMGVRASLRNSLRMTLLAVLFFGLPTLFIDRAVGGDYLWLFLVLINILPPTFSWFGGLAWCQHWALRVVIARQGWLPLRLVPWLDRMAALGLLRRVGGGYIFIHRSLLEYFASLEEW